MGLEQTEFPFDYSGRRRPGWRDSPGSPRARVKRRHLTQGDTYYRECKQCGKTFARPVNGSGRPRLYCSDECAAAAYSHHIREARERNKSKLVDAPPRQCKQCGEPVPPRRRSYCSDLCARLGDRKQASLPEVAACAECGGPYTPSRASEKYCSKTCVTRAANRKRLKIAVTLAELGDLDGWRCCFCGIAVERGETGKFAPSIHHVVPWSQGGSNAIENLRLAHNVCNTRARDFTPLIARVVPRAV